MALTAGKLPKATDATHIADSLISDDGTTVTVAGILAASAAITQTSNSATAFQSGPNGGANPVFRIVNSTASQADGISVTGGAAGAGTTIAALSSGADSSILFTPKGTGVVKVLTGAAGTSIGSNSGLAGIWLGQDTPTLQNVSLIATGGSTVLNSASGQPISFRIGISDLWNIDASHFFPVGNPLIIGKPSGDVTFVPDQIFSNENYIYGRAGSGDSDKVLKVYNSYAGTEKFSVTRGGIVPRYNGADTGGMGVVPIYAQSALNAQTGSIGATNLQVGGAVAPAGTYRLTYYLVTTTAGTSGTVKATFGWTDPGAARTLDSSTITFGTLAAPASGSVIIVADGIANITYSTTVTSPVGSPAYAIRVVLERLL